MRNTTTYILTLFFLPFVAFTQVGVKTTNPQAMLHVEGSARLEHSSARNGKILQMTPDGNILWASPYNLQLISGTLNSRGADLQVDNQRYYTGASITIPKGKFLIKGCFLVRGRSSYSLSQGAWVTIYLGDSNTSSTITSDVIANSAQQMSGGISGSLYAILDGSIAVENLGNTPKTYYIWAYKQNFGTSTTNDVYDFGGAAWGENIIYALAFD